MLGYATSNFDSTQVAGEVDAGDGGLFAGAPDANPSSSSGCGGKCFGQTPVPITMQQGVLADLYVLNSLTVADSVSVVLDGPNPVILAVLGAVDIEGELIVTAGGLVSPSPGPGAGTSAFNGAEFGVGGGGGLCGPGGPGYTDSSTLAPGGTTYGSANLMPLVPGSGGGNGLFGGPGGAGGGALQVSSGTSITVGLLGVISAPGMGGNSPAGGGSGGSILLEAPSLAVYGVIAANGGNSCGSGLPNATPVTCGENNGETAGSGSAGAVLQGGNYTLADAGSNGTSLGGAGGAGYLRLNTMAGGMTIGPNAILSPSLGTTCATQGPL